MDSQLHIFFFPYMAPGHMIPATEMAKLFASRGCKATIISTPPTYAPNIHKAIESSINLGLEIGVLSIRFPTQDVGLPEGCDSANSVTSKEMMNKFFTAVSMLYQPLEQLLMELRPNCLSADIFFPWATEVSAKFGIPRLVFHGTSFFALCASTSLFRHEPHKQASSDSDPFVIPNLPDEIKITRNELPDYMKDKSELSGFLKKVEESELKSYGVIVNSCYMNLNQLMLITAGTSLV